MEAKGCNADEFGMSHFNAAIVRPVVDENHVERLVQAGLTRERGQTGSQKVAAIPVDDDYSDGRLGAGGLGWKHSLCIMT